jgi:hypothetical protein
LGQAWYYLRNAVSTTRFCEWPDLVPFSGLMPEMVHCRGFA